MKPRASLIAALSASLASPAIAQTRTKADNTTSLNLASSYVENTTVPNSTITMIVDNTLTANRTSALGGDVSVLGINMNAIPVSGSSRQFQINGTTGATLTLFGGGINKATNTSALIINSATALGANQTWTINSATGTGTGNLQLNTTSFNDAGFTLAVNGAGVLDLRPSGNLSLGSNVTIDTTVSVNNSAAVVTFGGANTFNTLNVPNGRVVGSTIGNFGVASNFGDGGTNTAITLGNTTNGTLEYTGSSVATNRTFNRDARSSSSGIEVTNASTTLTISGNLGSGTQTNTGTNGWVFAGSGNLTLNGIINNSTGAGSTGTTVTKNGLGTLSLGNANTYSGDTTVTAGTLIVNNTTGSATGTGAVNVSTGAALGGAGIISGATTISGSLRPGNSIGTLTVGNDVTWNAGNAWIFELGVASVNLAAANIGGTRDLLDLTNAGSDFIKGTGTTFTFDFANTGAAGWYKLVDWTGATTFSAGDFSATNLASGLTGSFTIDSGTSALYLNVIPEPGAALLGGIGLLALLRRRR